MLTADTALELWTYAASLLNCHFYELTNTVLVEYLEWVNLQNLLLQVYWEE